eukprot:scaffold52912_cov73-Phaeocystis_antarctica.AAC.1
MPARYGMRCVRERAWGSAAQLRRRRGGARWRCMWLACLGELWVGSGRQKVHAENEAVTEIEGSNFSDSNFSDSNVGVLSRQQVCAATCGQARVSGVCVNQTTREAVRVLPLVHVRAAYHYHARSLS